MSWYKEAKDEDYDKMKNWFETRTARHIKLVQKYCQKLSTYDDGKYEELIKRGEIHDQSKYKDPEIEPYIYTTWQYKCKDDGVEFECPEGMDEKMNKATEHHVKNNAHHPEFHSKKEVDLINREDRDKPPEEMIDATEMTDLDLAEMCCDWVSMSEEKGNTPRGWADKNVNVRWKFDDEQEELIYELLDEAWGK
jgi:hypothetical protein